MKAWKSWGPDGKLMLAVVAGWFAPQISRLLEGADETLPVLALYAWLGLFTVALFALQGIKDAAYAKGRDDMFAELSRWGRLKEAPELDPDSHATSGASFEPLPPPDAQTDIQRLQEHYGLTAEETQELLGDPRGEIIVECGIEGGSLMLLGSKDALGWRRFSHLYLREQFTRR
jgi:hypothetical protein